MRIRVRDHVAYKADRLAKVALAKTPRAQLDLYCVAPGQSQTLHAHADQDKVYLVLEGQGRFTVGDAEERLQAGDAIVAEAGAQHGLVNDTAAPLLVVVLVTPPPPHP